MATALKAHLEPACEHHAFNPWRTLGGGMDDVTIQRGKCPSCQAWLEITTWASTDYSEERALDASEIRDLLQGELV